MPAVASPLAFSGLRPAHFLAFAAISPLPDATRAALAAYVDGLSAEGMGAMGGWLRARESARQRLGTLLNVASANLAFTSSTTQSLHIIAHSLRWGPGDAVLVFEGEFPANVHAWQQVAQARGLRVMRLPLDAVGDDAEGLDALLAGQGVRLVATSAVQFQTGRRMPLAAMAHICHRHGALFSVDAIQAAGAVPLDLTAAGVDFAMGGGHKWLLALDGVGWLYVAPGREAEVAPNFTGWLSVESPVRFLFEPDALDYDAPLIAVPRVFEAGSSSTAAIVALDASLGAILEVGVEMIYAATQRYHDMIEPVLVAGGFVSERRANPAARSGILGLRPPPGVVLSQLQARLAEQGIAVTIPDGRLRIAPHLVSDAGTADRVGEAIVRAAASL